MKIRFYGISGAILSCLLLSLSPAAAQSTAFSYQGQLSVSSQPANGNYDFEFRLYDALTNGNQVPVVSMSTNVAVSNGLFTTSMDFSNSVFTGSDHYLDISVQPHNSGSFTTLSPRQPILPTPGAIFAGTAGGLTGVIANNQVSGSFATVGGGNANINLAFDGTIGGGTRNFCDGNYDTIAGGVNNSCHSRNETISGGDGNICASNAFFSTIAGGAVNEADGPNSTIGGGQLNVVSGNFATVGGGYFNVVNGSYATVPGGYENTALGDNSFAAGRQAFAAHSGAFVWADSQSGEFASTGDNQFDIRAQGGVGIGMANPQAQLNVSGDARIDAVNAAYNEGLALNCPTDMSGGSFGGIHFHVAARGAAFSSSTIKWGIFYNYVPEIGTGSGGFSFVQNNSNTRFFIATNGNVGIGTSSPTNKLHVVGGVSATAFVTTSDRNAKENFAAVSPQDVLAKVAALPITTWNFKEMRDGRHMGPMAQDFYAAFGLGGSDTTITTVDPDGVALAAIQGLNQKLEAGSEKSEGRIQRLESENAELKARLEKIERLFSAR